MLYRFAEDHVLSALPGYGFAIDAASAPCDDFLSQLKRFLTEFCGCYQREIDAQLEKSDVRKTKEDLLSWTVSEICNLIHRALDAYRNKIIDDEMILLESRKIPCGKALTYFHVFVSELERAKATRLAEMQVPPRSERHRRKRADHDWMPYGVEIDFGAIIRLLSRK